MIRISDLSYKELQRLSKEKGIHANNNKQSLIDNLTTFNQNVPIIDESIPKMKNRTFKLLLVGDGGVGKSTFVKRHLTGEYDRKYIPTTGVEIHCLVFETNRGKVCFDIWDTAGQEKFGGLMDGYFIGGHGTILMFDTTNKTSYNSLKNFYNNVNNICGKIPSVLCGNKIDNTKDKNVHNVTFHTKHDMDYFEISSRNNYNFEKPFLSLARKLTNDPTLIFIEKKAILPPICSII
jgi:GTP-binding nuclear protein Ran